MCFCHRDKTVSHMGTCGSCSDSPGHHQNTGADFIQSFATISIRAETLGPLGPGKKKVSSSPPTPNILEPREITNT